LKNHPNALPNLVKEHNLDVLMLQETKLQESHVDDPKLQIKGHLLEEEGYDAHYSCSTSKKGYSGTAVFVKRRGAKGAKKQQKLDSFFGAKKGTTSTDSDSNNLPIDVANLIPREVAFAIGKDEHDKEGRVITLDFPLFSLTNAYVPNSGQKLERLDYRTEQWDKDFLAYHQKMDRPVIWGGDLNVAHTNLDVWNDGAKHLATQAGVTQQERDSFQAQLDAGFLDAFRKLHPNAKGHYSYWSQRAGNREPNKGLRLDYFICSPSLFDDSEESKIIVRDSYTLHGVIGSDHCPVVLELEIRK
jgi:exodeoxyribonuclease III